MQDLIYENLAKVKVASRALIKLTDDKIKDVLTDLADEAAASKPQLLQANKADLDQMDPENPKYDRLMLTEARIDAIAADLANVAGLPMPQGRVLEEKIMPNKLKISKVTVPLGVVGIIYEARPNVTFDVFGLCLKSGNAVVLKGGSDAANSNRAIVKLIHKVLQKHNLPTDLVYLLPPDRAAADIMMAAENFINIIIPRGSQGLINHVRKNSTVPVIETGAGIVHTYVDASADDAKAINIVVNAKTRRVSVCNALDCLVLHKDKLHILPAMGKKMADKNVVIYADEPALKALKDTYPANLLKPAQPEHYGTEFLSHKMAIKTVDSVDQAIAHVQQYTSMHSEAIVAEDAQVLERYLNEIDAAAVYANASTAFTDGAQFGLGAEIGISTQKLHARGPMALPELNTYKWVVRGDGHIRP